MRAAGGSDEAGRLRTRRIRHLIGCNPVSERIRPVGSCDAAPRGDLDSLLAAGKVAM
jgi:hypothetical protein